MNAKRALILSANDFEDTELLVPYYRLLEAGFQVDVASDKGNPIRGKHGYEVPVTKVFNELSQDQYSNYDLLLLPGGKAPAAIRNNQKVQEIARFFMNEQKPVAAICHGPQILISAGVVRGRKATCYKTVVTELREAAAQYQDTEVIVDGNLITSREPNDLPAFCREMMNLLGVQGQSGQQGMQFQQGGQHVEGQQNQQAQPNLEGQENWWGQQNQNVQGQQGTNLQGQGQEHPLSQKDFQGQQGPQNPHVQQAQQFPRGEQNKERK